MNDINIKLFVLNEQNEKVLFNPNQHRKVVNEAYRIREEIKECLLKDFLNELRRPPHETSTPNYPSNPVKVR